MTSQRIFIKPYRPDLRWIESLLGESLQIPAQPPIHGSIRAECDAREIPQGEFCYDIAARDHGEYVPCLYFQYTAHDSVKCLYLGVEAVDGMSQEFLNHFGSRDKAFAAGVIDTYTLPDSVKVCEMHLAYPATAEILQYRLDDYEQAIFGKRRDSWDQPFYTGYWDHASQLNAALIARYKIWEALCGMTEDVSPAMIKRLQLIDAMLRGHTEPADTLFDKVFSPEVKRFATPEKQFWYLYRKNFERVKNAFAIASKMPQ
jgi:hypothetical protein